MKQNQWFAVRCCCTPKKVLGFLKLVAPNNISLPDHRTLTDNYGQEHPIKLMSIYVNKHYPCGVKDFKDFMNFAPQEDIEHTTPEIAIYSDDRPIEFWRTIPGFVEAPPEEED